MPSKTDIQDLYFMDSRFKLLEIAAFLDRVDRHEGEVDFRHPAFMRALEAMQNPSGGKNPRPSRPSRLFRSQHRACRKSDHPIRLRSSLRSGREGKQGLKGFLLMLILIP